MRVRMKAFGVCLAAAAVSLPSICPAGENGGGHEETAEITRSAPPVLWRTPALIAASNLYYGPGGKEHQPHGAFTFVKEDRDGTNPKFVVRDDEGVKWQVKLGAEARPETAASRLTWAVGYFANEDYFLPALRVRNLPARLHRGQQMVARDGSVHNVRLKRYPEGQQKIGIWRWRHDPFSGTRELNGLRVMMALISNWDLKDVNNAIYVDADGEESRGREQVYMVSDLGATFGTSGPNWPHDKAKGNIRSYSRGKFVGKVTADYVDFEVPGRPALPYLFNPLAFFSRLRLCSIGKHIPRADVRWIGGLLNQLSAKQIRDAFEAAGYSPQEVDAFASVVENRIAELEKL